MADYSKDELNQIFADDPKPSDSEWQQVGGDMNDVWSFDENNTLEGLYLKMKDGVGKNRSKVYSIQTAGADSKTYDVWGSTVLDKKMAEVPFHHEVRIVYKGKDRNDKGTEYRVYEVFHRLPVMKAV